jgi:hypothetical protein
MKRDIAVPLLLLVCLGALAAQKTETQTFEGEISDSQCGLNVHSKTRSHNEMIKTGYMGNTPEECTRSCVKRKGQFVFVLSDKKDAYKIGRQDTVKDFAGKKVRVQGFLTDGKVRVLHVVGIKPI